MIQTALHANGTCSGQDLCINLTHNHMENMEVIVYTYRYTNLDKLIEAVNKVSEFVFQMMNCFISKIMNFGRMGASTPSILRVSDTNNLHYNVISG